jgi:hypothetical protein
MTAQQAEDRLCELANEAEQENYHELCSQLYDIASEVRKLSERTLIFVPVMYGGIEKILVEV